METPKFLRKYKLVFKVIKYVIGFIAMMYLILATMAVLVVTLVVESVDKLKSLFK